MADETGRAERAARGRWWVLPSIWLAVALVFITQNYLGAVNRHEPPNWLRIAAFELEYWFTFLLLSPLIFRTARAWRIGRGVPRRNYVVHVSAAMGFALIQPILAGLLNVATQLLANAAVVIPQPGVARFVFRSYDVMVLIALWKYAVIVGLYYAFDYHRKYHAHDVLNAQLESRLVSAQLSALRAQVRPHFLFNALHSISLLSLSDPRRAHEVIVQLADLLRESLESEQAPEVTITQELAFLERYLRIERVRFEDRLRVTYDIAPEVVNSVIPSLILQPLVENVMHHSIARHSTAGLLAIRAHSAGGALVLEVEDDGPGLVAGSSYEAIAGTGLRNVQSRVDLSWQAHRPIELISGEPGLLVRFTLPLRFA